MITVDRRFLRDLQALPPREKLKLAEFLLEELDKPDPTLDALWAKEAQRRSKAYHKGAIPAYSVEEVFGKTL